MQTGRPTLKGGGNYQRIGAIQQNSSGASNSNVAGVQGNVSVTIAPPNQDNRSNGDPDHQAGERPSAFPALDDEFFGIRRSGPGLLGAERDGA
jgi:hypothetical protein